MSTYAPPFENVAIFDAINFSSGETVLTQNAADKRYLRFPNAQGTENLQAINVNGQSSFNAAATFNVSLGQPVTITSTFAQGADTILQLQNTNSGVTRTLDYIPNAGSGSYNQIVQSGDKLIMATSSTSSNDPLNNFTIAPWSTLRNGLRIKASDGTTELGGIVNFTNLAPPTSSQTIPASNDSSNKIPTTQWVQSAIAATPTQFVPKFKNYTDVQTTSGSGYSSGPIVNFNGTWNINDIAYFRVTSQVSYSDTGSGYQNTGNSMGVLLVRPHYMYSQWGGVSPGVSTIVQMCNNSPSTVMGADRKIAFYTPCYNIGGVQNFIISGNSNFLQFGVLSFQTTGGWEYFVSVEYLGARVSGGGTVSFSNGSGAGSINDSLP